jgi:hypothetical protein
MHYSKVFRNSGAQIQNRFGTVLGLFKLGGSGDEGGVHTS